jgi:hypothetical protein
VDVFHYHLVTNKLRRVEERYLAKLGFRLVARHGRIGEDSRSFEPGTSWEELERLGFRARLSELERGAVNVVVQPGQWTLPRVDHIGVALDEDEFGTVVSRALELGLRVQEHGGRRTFISTSSGFRLEVHPPRDWIDDLLAETDDLALSELHLRADEPDERAAIVAEVLDVASEKGRVRIGDTLLRFVSGGPRGRPELEAELFT